MAAPSSSTSSSNKGLTFASINSGATAVSEEAESYQSTREKAKKLVSESTPHLLPDPHVSESTALSFQTTQLLHPVEEEPPFSHDRALQPLNSSSQNLLSDQEATVEHRLVKSDNRIPFLAADIALDFISHPIGKILVKTGCGQYAPLASFPGFVVSVVGKVNEAQKSGKPFDLELIVYESFIELAFKSKLSPGLQAVFTISYLAHIQKPLLREYLEYCETNIHPLNDEHESDRYAAVGYNEAVSIPHENLECITHTLAQIAKFARVMLPNMLSETLIDPRVTLKLWQQNLRELGINVTLPGPGDRILLFPDASSQAVSPVRLFAPSLASLAPTSIVQFVNRLFLGPDTFSNCTLPWQATQSASTGVTTVSTFVEVPQAELAQLEALPPIDWDPSLPVLVPLPKSSESCEPEKPSFRERSRIIGIRAGEVHGRGRGLIISLAGGADVSLTSEGNRYYTGVSAPLTLDFLSSLGSGILYAVPMAVAIYGIHMAVEGNAKRFYKRLEKDGKDTQKDIKRINNSVQQFNNFIDQFSRGEINQEAFLAKLNALTAQIHLASKEMGKRGRYLDQDRTEFGRKTSCGEEAFLSHFAGKTILQQVDRDLETIAAAVIAQREVQDQYTPKLKERPFRTLCEDLQALFNKRVLSLQEKYQQQALIQEISSRVHRENVEDLSRLEALTNQPVAISLQPAGVAKPMHLSSRHFENGSTPSKKRRAERVRSWANKLDEAYQHFRHIALTGNVEEMEKAAEAVFHQFQRAKEKDIYRYYVNADSPDPDISIKRTGDYYQSYVTAIESNTQATLAKARAAKSGVVTPDLPALFTQEELNSLKAEAAISAFNAALSSFQTEEEANKDTAFVQMYEAAQVLDTLKHKAESEEDNKLVQSTLSIGREHGTYSNYQRSQDRLKTIRADIETIQSAVEKVDDPLVKKEERAKQHKLALESATRLKEMGLTEEDTAKLTDNPENSRLLLACVNSVYEGYPHLVRIDHYESTVLHAVSTPLSRITLHILNDLHRYEGYALLKRVGWGLTTMQAISPAVLPSTINWAIAFSRRESSVVTGALSERIYGAFTNNIFTCSAYFIFSPLQTLEKAKSFSKKTSLASNTSMALQMGATIVTTLTATVFGENRVRTFNSVVSFVPPTLGTASSALYYANILNKTNRYLKAGTLSLKLHKVGQAWINLGFDMYELCATDPAELGVVTRWVKKVLPTFHGQLPETKSYYEGKDVVALTVATGGLYLAAGPATIGIAAAQAAIMVWNRCTGAYANDALSATLANCRYHLRQKSSEENDQALAISLKSLEDKIESSHRIETSDSPIKKQARLFHFECILADLEKREEWDEIIEQTSFAAKGENYKFIHLNIDVFDAVTVLLRHFSAATQSPAHIVKKADELDAISKYLTRKISDRPAQDKAKDYTSTINENLSRIRSQLHSNFGVFFIKNQLSSNPWFALKMFDGIAREHRELVDWWVLGSIVSQLRSSEDPTSIKLSALERFCFLTVVELLNHKEGIFTAFEQDLQRCSGEALKELNGMLPEGFTGITVTTDTTNFTRVIQKILPPKQVEARLLETGRKSLD